MTLLLRMYRRLAGWLGSRRWGSSFIRRFYQPVDRALFRLTGGRRGLAPTQTVLLLTSTGRKTGQPRSNPLMYVEHDDSFWVMGSNFGQNHHPAWTSNLIANTNATVKVGRRTVPVGARLASDEERKQLWPQLVEAYPAFDTYTGWTKRGFRLFELKPR